MKRTLGIFLLLIALVVSLQAQTPLNISPEQIQEELAKRGVEGMSTAEAIFRLEEKGIDLNEVTAENAAQIDQALDEISKEYEAELEAEEAAAKEQTEKELEDIEANDNLEKDEKEQAKEIVKKEAENEEKVKQAQELADSALEQLDEREKEIRDSLEEERNNLNLLSAEKIQRRLDAGETLDEAIANELGQISQNKKKRSVIWGQQIFRDKQLDKYNSGIDVRASDSYILDNGDEISVNIFGKSKYSGSFQVTEGYVVPNQFVGRIYVKGMTFGAAKDAIRKAFAKNYRFNNDQISITVVYSRNINVNIVGEAIQFGSFNIPASNNVFNALAFAGGPTNIGSVRNIKIYRNGVPTTVDVYEYLLNPGVAENYYLEEGDFIHIPVATKVVSISGAIKRPFSYELKDNENLVKLIDWAAGLNVNAYQKNIRIIRKENDLEKIIDLNLREMLEQGRDFKLVNGDRIFIPNIPKEYENFATIQGAVQLPGRYEVTKDMKVLDLVKMGVLDEDARKDVIYVFRKRENQKTEYIRLNFEEILNNPNSSENITLQAKDQIRVFSVKPIINREAVVVQGAVRSPGNYVYDDSLKISDVILLSNGLKDDAYGIAYLYRKDVSKVNVQEYIKINLNNVVGNNTEEDLQLEPGDRLMVLSNSMFAKRGQVSINGSIRNPNDYIWDESLNIFDIITMSGGLNEDANGFAYIFRKDPSKIKQQEYVKVDLSEVMLGRTRPEWQLRPGDQIRVLSNATFIYQSNVKIAGEVKNPGEYDYDESLTLNDVLTLAGGLTLRADNSKIDIYRIEIQRGQPTKTVLESVEVNENLELIGSTIQLQPYDEIIVRSSPNFKLQRYITIQGEVMRPGRYAIQEDNDRLLDIIERAGGLTNEAFEEGVTLLRKEDNRGYLIVDYEKANKKPTSGFNYILLPGDIISIPKDRNLVTITGLVRANDVLPDSIAATQKYNVPHMKGRSAKFYIDEYVAGIDRERRGHSSYVTVIQPNGKVERTRRFGLFKIYPKPDNGATIIVGAKPERNKDDEGEQTPVDWGEIISNTVTQATAILTLVLLIQNLD